MDILIALLLIVTVACALPLAAVACYRLWDACRRELRLLRWTRSNHSYMARWKETDR